MSDRFHVNSPLAPGPVVLEGPEAHHLATVCRLRPGDEVCLFNGDGHEYPGKVVEVGKRVGGRVVVEVLAVESPARELPFDLVLAVALPKGDRADFLVEKATELGVTALVPLSTVRGVVHPREAKLERLERHVIEASKQCRRNVLMRIEPPAEWPAFCVRPDLPGRKLLAHPGGAPLAESPGATVVAVGPEGGFTDDEVARAVAAGWQVVGLGPRVLRVETAALALAARLGGT